MKVDKTIKLVFFCLSFLFLLSACNLMSNLGTQPVSTVTPLPSMTVQSAPVQDATIAIVPSSTTSSVTAAATATSTFTLTPTMTLTATNTSVAPFVLSWEAYSYSCEYATGGTTMTMSLNWNDPSNAEDGFRVYRNDVAIATLTANSTSYVDVTFIPAGNSVKYFIEVFTGSWQVRSSTIEYSCN